MKDRIMPRPRDEDDDEEKRDTDDENDEYEPQGDEAEPWQVGANCCTSEGHTIIGIFGGPSQRLSGPYALGIIAAS
jgi:hypothetical protein